MRSALQKDGDKLSITAAPGRPSVVTFSDSIDSVVRSFMNSRIDTDEEDVEPVSDKDEKMRVLKAAVKIIKDDIMLVPSLGEWYPSLEDMSNKDKVNN